ncbi:DUF1109 domain-containing protein [Devosia sp.]|uniref:DUF1109 domain-containing protein n=1 Tax=Devosia sp. TaxID=1871048 RepID=UPI001ACC2BC2|nr:DUF1109 domain-containing protein [Devosia sp.]MBN9310285.1 DUF1109 domain-containing protein [Devosia sp.]
MADDLIDHLAADLAPTPPRTLQQRLFGWAVLGVAVSAVLMIAWLGLRPDLMIAIGTMMFWVKFAFTAIFAALGALAALNLARPGGSMVRQAVGVVTLVALTGAAGIVQMLVMGPGEMRTLVFGGTALLCPFYIVALSVPIYAATVWAMRRAAPTNLPLAGFAAGLFAGGAATWVYAFHCTESGMPFITIWYTTGILAAAVLGAIVGRWALRWR